MKVPVIALVILGFCLPTLLKANYPIFVGTVGELEAHWKFLVEDSLLKSILDSKAVSVQAQGSDRIEFATLRFLDEKRQRVVARVGFGWSGKSDFTNSVIGLQKPGWFDPQVSGFQTTRLPSEFTEQFIKRASTLAQDVKKLSDVSYYDIEEKQMAACQRVLEFSLDIKDLTKLKELVMMYFSHDPKLGKVEINLH